MWTRRTCRVEYLHVSAARYQLGCNSQTGYSGTYDRPDSHAGQS